ncbi:SAG family member [Eimeria brunetti]|uniref:SAG family member n=1 Tax=Eimeria brunetti TaxID=51314 RepID=U6L5G1_9EIME|nr:SAG family member [Eimeria brunetti]
MASLCKTAAAVCLVALYGLQSDAAGKTTTYTFTPEVVDEAGYLAANLVRNGKLPVHISTVTKSETIVSSLKTTVGSKTASKAGEDLSDTTCSGLMEGADLKDIFNHVFDYANGPNYPDLLQTALNKGLEAFKKTDYQNQWEKIWQDDAGANLAYLLGANSTTIGCVIGKCTTETTEGSGERSSSPKLTGKAVLFCELKPPAEKGKAPFDGEYYDGLIARTAKLADMTEEDLKASSNDGTAAAAVPTILAAGFVAMLTAIGA